jgi:hypothetical protein
MRLLRLFAAILVYFIVFLSASPCHLLVVYVFFSVLRIRVRSGFRATSGFVSFSL